MALTEIREKKVIRHFRPAPFSVVCSVVGCCLPYPLRAIDRENGVNYNHVTFIIPIGTIYFAYPRAKSMATDGQDYRLFLVPFLLITSPVSTRTLGDRIAADLVTELVT